MEQPSITRVKIVSMWQETKEGLYKSFNFSDFKEAFAFIGQVAQLAEEVQHHPRWTNEYNKLEIWLSTHEADNEITDKDRELAMQIDEIKT
ncbi:MAG TPA: 4a-hydroxytetrahydrobiopterin dehydratase [Candidatus Saccharimonadales bacterium]|nr:4a-hydroxytetrahydrobiopterin dehydratase [Candidatus Saccharimonadales bacterium]